MFSLLKQEEGEEEYEAPLVAIEKMNAMISSLVNKLPKVRLGPWLSSSHEIKKKELLKKLPMKVDVAKHYVFDYNRFISPGQRGYCKSPIIFPTIYHNSYDIKHYCSI